MVGLGRGGVLLLRELRENPALGYRAIGFVDDDPSKRGAIVQGLRVLGNRRDLPRLLQKYGVGDVLLAIPSAPPELAAEVREICTTTGAQFRRLELNLQ